jgi:Rad3-related DNA helicase
MNTGSMTFKNKMETLPKVLVQIMKILDHHKNHRGIIHTHNFEIAYYIRDNIDEKYLERLVFQDNFRTRYEMLEYHAQHPNSVIVAPAMHEGLDLKDDLSRFQILCKVPYPNPKADKRLEIRMKESWQYYAWLTCLKLVQSYGRSVRSEEDWALTYILDSQFKTFYNQTKFMLPEWFKEAIVWAM